MFASLWAPPGEVGHLTFSVSMRPPGVVCRRLGFSDGRPPLGGDPGRLRTAHHAVEIRGPEAVAFERNRQAVRTPSKSLEQNVGVLSPSDVADRAISFSVRRMSLAIALALAATFYAAGYALPLLMHLSAAA